MKKNKTFGTELLNCYIYIYIKDVIRHPLKNEQAQEPYVPAWAQQDHGRSLAGSLLFPLGFLIISK